MEWSGTKSISFPLFKFDKEFVPMGDSMVMCMGFKWILKENRHQVDRYLAVRNLPECDEYKSSRSQWEEDYPTHGIDFNLWKQEAKKGDSSCSGGIYMDK